MPDSEDFRRELRAQIKRASNQGREHVEINAGELHRVVGGYPSGNGRSHSMPLCCAIMRQELNLVEGEIVYEPERKQGAALTIRYLLRKSDKA